MTTTIIIVATPKTTKAKTVINSREKKDHNGRKTSDVQYNCTPPAGWCPACPWAVTGDTWPAPLSLYTKHDTLWDGKSLCPICISCHGCVPSQFPVHLLMWQSMGNWKVFDLEQELLSKNWNINVLPPLFSYWVQNTLLATKTKINSIPAKNRQGPMSFNIQFLLCQFPSSPATHHLSYLLIDMPTAVIP